MEYEAAEDLTGLVFHPHATRDHDQQRFAVYTPHAWGGFGFGFINGPEIGMDPGYNIYVLRLPDWFLMLLFARLPAGWARVIWRRRRRRKLGLCVACGYDLRATPARCPECGAESAIAGTAAGPA